MEKLFNGKTDVTSSQLSKVKNAQYVILTGKMGSRSPYFDLYQNVYRLWHKTWKETFDSVGSMNEFSPDDFYRQDYIPVIANGSEPIAAHFYTEFHLDNPVAMDHHYFSIFSGEAIEKLKSKNVNSVLSLEFLTVNPKFRKSQVEFSLAEVISTLGCYLLIDLNLDAAIGVAVKAAKVDKMALKLGFDILDNNAKRGQLVCDIVVKYANTVEAKIHPNDIVHEYVSGLWGKRVDCSNQLYNKVV